MRFPKRKPYRISFRLTGPLNKDKYYPYRFWFGSRPAVTWRECFKRALAFMHLVDLNRQGAFSEGGIYMLQIDFKRLKSKAVLLKKENPAHDKAELADN